MLYDGEVTVDDLLDDTTLDGSNDDFLCQDQEPPAASPCRNELLSVAVARSNTTSPPAPSQNELLHAPASNTTWDPTAGGRYELLSTYVPPPFRDEEEAVVEWPEAAGVGTSDPALDLFWGTPNGVCMY